MTDAEDQGLRAIGWLGFQLAQPIPLREAIFIEDQSEEYDALRKYDGIRALIYRHHEGVLIQGRGSDLTGDFPELVDAAKSLPGPIALDGEIVRIRHGGLCDLQTVVDRVNSSRAAILANYEPCEFRVLRIFSHYIEEHTPRVHEVFRPAERATLEKAEAQGWEGVVYHRKDAPYGAGRTGNWLKLCLREGDRRAGD